MRTFLKTGMAEIRRRKKLIWLWYLLNLLCAMVIVAPLAVGIAASLGHSLENPRLFQNFDISWVVEFGAGAHWEQFTTWLPVAAMIGVVFVLLTNWLSGGLLGVLHNPSDTFIAGCARWQGPFVRLLLLAAVGYGLAFGVRALFAAFIRKLSEDSMSGQPAAYGSMATFLVTCLGFGFVNMIVDYAKIYMVYRDERRARFGLAGGARFVFSNFQACAATYLALTGYMILMLGVYDIWSEVIGQASIGAVLLLFVARQIYMFGRTWLRMVFLASEYTLYASRMPKPEPEPPIPPPVIESLELNESF